MTRLMQEHVFRFLCFMFLISSAALAQRDTGSVSGVITDPNGAVVPGVSIQLVEPETGLTRTATSNEAGLYTFPAVSTGKYRLSAQVSGFKRYEQPNITLQVNQNLTVPISLTIGEVAETVEVTGTPVQVDTASSSVKQVVDSTRIRELPLNGRNVLQLQQLAPGAVFAGSGDQFGNTPSFQVNGGTLFSNNYTLDGGEHVDSFFNSAVTFPNPDALEEFSIQTSSYSAEYGRNRGATVNAVTRSGTNKLHGTLYEFVRNDAFDARDLFARAAPPFKRNQFGGTIGGPIRRNKTFFFGAWESTRERGAPSVATFRTPSAAMRSGNFAELATSIVDPVTRQPFAGNIIPADRLNKAAVAFLDKYIPQPNGTARLYSAARAVKFDRDQFVGRGDHDFSDKDRVFVRYLYTKDDLTRNRGDLVDWYETPAIARQAVTAGHTRSFTPAVLNSFTFTYNREAHLVDIIPHFSWKALGANIPEVKEQQAGWVQVQLPGYFSAINGVPWDVSRNTLNFADTATWVSGQHTLKFGAQISRYGTHQIFEWFSASSTTFTGEFSGDAASDFLLGRISNIRQGSPGFNDLRQTLWGFFASDDYKVSRRLTLNLGLRYEPYFGFKELNGKVVAFRRGQQSKAYPTAPQGMLFQGDAGVHDNLFGNDWNNLAPRVGFAWDVLGNQKIAVRGGYGFFYDAVAGIRLNRFPYNQPFMLDLTVFDRTLDNPYLGQPPFPYVRPTSAQERAAFQFVVPSNVTSANENMVTPYTQQWNFTIETQLPYSFLLSTGYVGSKSSKLYGSRNINQAIYAPGASAANIQARRPYPLLAQIEDTHTTGYSQYHSVQVQLTRRLANNFTINSAYTFSKNTGYTGSQGEGSVGTRDAYNARLDNGILNLDATHVSSTSGVWRLPELKSSGVLGYVLGGWEMTGIMQLQSGFPFTVRSGNNRSFNGQGLDTADLIGVPTYTTGSRGDKINAWFNTKAFALNAVGTVGNVGINTMRGPGLLNVDAGVYKN
ncbi:MAG TPA: TonB-dependent receptor, partial [Bryobacteraceae bacterium]|nr:TonB-dependent receptor [Bryobacteraceae bacterium]